MTYGKRQWKKQTKNQAEMTVNGSFQLKSLRLRRPEVIRVARVIRVWTEESNGCLVTKIGETKAS